MATDEWIFNLQVNGAVLQLMKGNWMLGNWTPTQTARDYLYAHRDILNEYLCNLSRLRPKGHKKKLERAWTSLQDSPIFLAIVIQFYKKDPEDKRAFDARKPLEEMLRKIYVAFPTSNNGKFQYDFIEYLKANTDYSSEQWRSVLDGDHDLNTLGDNPKPQENIKTEEFKFETEIDASELALPRLSKEILKQDKANRHAFAAAYISNKISEEQDKQDSSRKWQWLYTEMATGFDASFDLLPEDSANIHDNYLAFIASVRKLALDANPASRHKHHYETLCKTATAYYKAALEKTGTDQAETEFTTALGNLPKTISNTTAPAALGVLLAGLCLVAAITAAFSPWLIAAGFLLSVVAFTVAGFSCHMNWSNSWKTKLLQIHNLGLFKSAGSAPAAQGQTWIKANTFN